MKKPANSFWSDAQYEAIYKRGGNILVSAGAGSGKTAVLTERIVSLIQEGKSLKNIIVLTFTEASAKEMKDRIQDRIKEEVIKKTINENELDYLEQAFITTFDSFSLQIVKKYHYLLGISSDISIADKAVIAIVKTRIMEEIFEKYYSDSDFKVFLSDFTTKNDNNILSSMLDLYQNFSLIVDKQKYLDEYLSNHYSKSFLEKMLREYKELINKKKKAIKNIADEIGRLSSNTEFEKIYEKISVIVDELQKNDDYNMIKKVLEISLPQMPRNASDKELKERIRELKSDLKNRLDDLSCLIRFKNDEEICKDINASYKYVKVIVRVIKDFNEEFNKYKRENNQYEFIDIALLAIKLFSEHQEIKNEFKSSIAEILIDEYQDTSDIQETLITMLSNDNMYMVGDIKQSIYGFRNANPNIFKEKYELYKNGIGGQKIDLVENFRSREEVINGLNQIFSLIMDPILGGVNYEDGHKLVYGMKKYSDLVIENNQMQFMLYPKDCKKVLTESYIIFNDIKKKIDTGFMVFDKKTKSMRKAKYNDFVILTPDKSNYEDYRKMSEYFHIPLVVHKDYPFIESDEIYAIYNIIRMIYSLIDENYYIDNFKVSLVSVLRSFLISLNDDKIYEILDGDILENLAKNYSDLWNMFLQLKEIATKNTIDVLLSSIIEKFSIYENLVKLGNYNELTNKIRFLLKKVKTLSENGYLLVDLINYLDSIFKQNIDFEYDLEDNNNESVNIMTIHKSKGLEFPICYFSDLYKKFNLSDLNGSILFNNKYGIITKYYAEGLKKSVIYDLYQDYYINEAISEKIRLFYVALTRVREKAIFVLPSISDFYVLKKVSYDKKMLYRSFTDVLNSIGSLVSDYSTYPEYEESLNISFINKKTDLKTEECNTNFSNLILKKEIKKEKKSSIYDTKIITEKEKRNIKEGNKFHHAFEQLDFNNLILDEIDDDIKKKVFAFINNPLIKNLSIINTYKEYPFSYEENGLVYNGIIDLIFETEKELIVIDYKLNNLNIEYEEQLNSYKKYLQRISNKEIKTYLYSIFKNYFLEVK